MKLLNEPDYKKNDVSEKTRICSDIFIMVQAEVAKRIVATPETKDYGKLTVSVQYAAEVELIEWIDRKYFHPIPKVDSAIIRIKPRVSPPREVDSMKQFWSLINGIFQSRRKTLKNSLKQMDLAKPLLSYLDDNFDLSIRGESMSIEELAFLSNELSRY